MTAAPQPRMHGSTHVAGGSDPVPFGIEWEDVGLGCAASYSSLVLAEASLVAYWPLDEAAGSDAFDLSGNAYNFVYPGAFTGPPTQGDPGPFPSSPSETSYSFSADRLFQTNGHLDAQDTSSGAVTFEFWMYPTAYPSPLAAMPGQCADGTYSSIAYQAQLRSGGNMFWQVDNTGQIDSSPTTVALNTWVHFAGTSSGADAMKMYFNGALIVTGSTKAVPNVGAIFNLGYGENSSGSTFPFTGRLAQVAVYNAVLPAATILAHYNAGIA